MSEKEDQRMLIQIGIILAKKDPNINIQQVNNFKELTKYINDKFNVDIIEGMYLSDVLKALQ